MGGNGNINSCPEGYTKTSAVTECEAMANFFDWTYKGEVSEPDYPSGCYMDSEHYPFAVYVNTHATGGSHAKATPMCPKVVLGFDPMDAHIGSGDINSCPAGYTKTSSVTDCKAMAAAFDWTYKGEVSTPNYPSGCYMDWEHQPFAVYVNTHATGGPNSKATPMCPPSSVSSGLE